MADVEANKQRVRQMIDRVWTHGDLGALPEYWTEEWVDHAAPGDPVRLGALRAYHQSCAAQMAAFSDATVSVVQQVGEGDRVVTHLVTRSVHTGVFAGLDATGREVELVTIRVDRLDDGRIAEHWSVADVAGLMEQLQS